MENKLKLFIERSNIIHNNKYDYSKSIYTGIQNKILIIDEYGFTHLVTPEVHLLGCKLSIKSVIDKTKYLIFTFNLIHNYKYDYSKVKYNGSRIPHIIICPIHGEFKQRGEVHLHSCGCPKCGWLKISLTQQKSLNDFISNATLIHNNKYDYSKVNYTNCKKKIIITCPEHGEFEQTPDSHLKGRGCPKCWSINRVINNKRRHTTSEFIDKCMVKHGGYYDYSKVNYTNGCDNVTIICPNHGEFTQQAKLHLRGNGCPICKQSKGEKEIMLWLENNNIIYIPQYVFNNCKDIYSLPFDFYIPKYNICIEYNGIQHYKPISHFGGEDALIKQRKHDKIKTDYCRDNNITLLIIKYDEDINYKLINMLQI